MKNDVAKKIVYGKLVTKVNNIDITGFVLKTKYDTGKSDSEKKISDAKGKIASISGLVTNSALTAVKTKYLMLITYSKKKIITQKLVKLKKSQ